MAGGREDPGQRGTSKEAVDIGTGIGGRRGTCHVEGSGGRWDDGLSG